MKLWIRRASGALKDKNSALIASFSTKNAPWNPGFEVAIIKATSHDETKLDYKNTRRVFAWLHASPAYLKLLLRTLSIRLQKTRSWVVALKGLMLMHGVLRCNIPGVQKIGRLPFDLSHFGDGCRGSARRYSALNSFVKSYFGFLDQRSVFLCTEQREEGKETNTTRTAELVKLQQQQTLLDILLQIKPQAMEIDTSLVYEAMDCVIIEIFSFYNKSCSGVARVLTSIQAAEKVEAAMTLEILRKASEQSEQLVLYLEFCLEIGIFNAAKFPEVEKIPKREIQRLERIVYGVQENQYMPVKRIEPKEKQEEQDGVLRTIITEKEGAQWALKTIITDEWEIFDDEQDFVNEIDYFSTPGKTILGQHPTATPAKLTPTMHEQKYDLPDLISF